MEEVLRGEQEFRITVWSVIGISVVISTIRDRVKRLNKVSRTNTAGGQPDLNVVCLSGKVGENFSLFAVVRGKRAVHLRAHTHVRDFTRPLLTSLSRHLNELKRSLDVLKMPRQSLY